MIEAIRNHSTTSWQNKVKKAVNVCCVGDDPVSATKHIKKIFNYVKLCTIACAIVDADASMEGGI